MAAVALVLAMAPVMADIAAADRPVVHVAPLRTRLAAGAEVGRRGKGWTCFPAGAVHWRDLSFDPDEAAQAVAQTLVEQGVPAEVAPPYGRAGAPGDAYLLSGTIASVSVRTCSPQHGIGRLVGGGPTVRGRMTITVEWTVRGDEDGVVVRAFATEGEVEVSAKKAGEEAFLAAGWSRLGQDAAVTVKAVMAER